MKERRRSNSGGQQRTGGGEEEIVAYCWECLYNTRHEKVTAKQNTGTSDPNLDMSARGNVCKVCKDIAYKEGDDDKTVATTSSPRAWFSIFMPKKNKSEGRRSTLDHLRRLTQNNISAWTMKRLMRIVRKGVLSTLDE
ncbi:unnamed protein product [Cuscuta campestris]|uniref:Uncharacterized protein n=1 Tax=Cuscuta campestris TaxID=132261 RepID=A0A484KHD2_9ASTE|nr:unnamed protein product [Cuscuta campestris]